MMYYRSNHMRFLLLASFLITVQAVAQRNPPPPPPASRLRSSVMLMDQRRELAPPLLEAALKQSASLSDADRAFVLYRIAGGWMPLDRDHSTTLYRQAFLASLQADDSFRPALEYMILDEAVPLAPTVVLKLLPRADKQTQQKLYRAVLMYALMSSNAPLASAAFREAAAHQAVTGRMAANVLANLSNGERAQAFRTITTLYSQPPSSAGNWDFSGLISQFYASLPPQDVLAAIDTILKGARDSDSAHLGGQSSMSSGANNIFFRSDTELQLFALAPALQKLDAARAASLLEQHPDTAKWLIRYPQGLESFDQNHSFHGGVAVKPSNRVPTDLLTFGIDDAGELLNLLQTDEGLEFTREDFPRYIQPIGADFFEFTDHNSPEYAAYHAVVAAQQPDVLAAVASVPVMRKVPTTCSGPNGDWCDYAETYPQVGLIRSLADHWTYARKNDNARAALQALPVALEKIPAQDRCAPFADAGDLYLRMDDRHAAYSSVQAGFEAAAKAVDEEEVVFKKPSARLLRPSSSCYQELISAGVNADYDALYKAVDSIQDPALRAFATAALARALLGIPMRRNLVVYANGGYSALEGLGSYSSF